MGPVGLCAVGQGWSGGGAAARSQQGKERSF